MHTITRRQSTRGLPGNSLLYSGGAASAGKMKRRAGVPDDGGLVTVENGKRISFYELSRSVGAACERWLSQHSVPKGGISR